MSEVVVKAARDVDLYGVYSDSAAEFVFAGSRQQTRVFLSTPTEWRGVPPLAGADGPESRLSRADEVGTSARSRLGGGCLPGAFDDDRGFVIAVDAKRWLLRRSRLHLYLSAWVADDDDAASGFLESPEEGV